MSKRFINDSLLIALILFLLTGLFMSGCSSPVKTSNSQTNYDGPKIQYSTFKLEATDIRLKCLHHPLYRLEYPVIFELIDINLDKMPHYSCDETRVDFTVQQIEIPKSKLSIIVEKPSYRDYRNAAGKLEFWLSERSSADNLSTNETEVLGIPAYYLEAYFIHDIPPEGDYQYLSRSVFFDYAGLIWEITINWFYIDSVGPEVEEYFNHVIETFRILN